MRILDIRGKGIMRSIEKNYRYEGMPYVDLYRDTEAAAD
jgi:hypothetical protein